MRIVRVAERRDGGSRRPERAVRSLRLAAATWTSPLMLLAACTPAPPARSATGIVSLNPCTDAILAEVADPAQIAALSAYSSDPASSSMPLAMARRFPAVSGTVEEIAALRPGLVLGGTYTALATRSALSRLGIPLQEIPIASSVAQNLAQVRQIAALAGHPDRGEALVRRIRAALDATRPHDGLAVPALVWQSGGIVPGDQSLIADLLRHTGFANAAAARGLGQADYLPLERVLADPPRVILAAGGQGNEDRLLNHPALARLRGVRRATLDPSLLWCGGPTIIRAAARLASVRTGLDGVALSPSGESDGVALSPSGERYAGFPARRLAAGERGSPLSQPSPLKGRGLAPSHPEDLR